MNRKLLCSLLALAAVLSPWLTKMSQGVVAALDTIMRLLEGTRWVRWRYAH